MIDPLVKDIEQLKKSVSAVKAININSKTLKTNVIETVKVYFSDYRNYLKERDLGDDLIGFVDEHMQELMRLAQGNNSKKSFAIKLKEIDRVIKELSVKDVSIAAKPRVKIGESENAIISTLEAIVPSASLSYKQAIFDLAGSEPKFSYRGTATELRESLRETLDHLAPDSNVTGEAGFKFETDQTKPTMKQKVRYILKQREVNETMRAPTEKSTEMVDELLGQIARATYSRASLSTHLKTTKAEVLKVKRCVDLVLHELLEIG